MGEPWGIVWPPTVYQLYIVIPQLSIGITPRMPRLSYGKKTPYPMDYLNPLDPASFHVNCYGWYGATKSSLKP
jgi:hypothetical protein